MNVISIIQGHSGIKAPVLELDKVPNIGIEKVISSIIKILSRGIVSLL